MTIKPAKLSNRLRVLRAEHRLSLLKTATHLGISYNRIWMLENGYLEPTQDELKALAKLLKVPASDIFTTQVA